MWAVGRFGKNGGGKLRLREGRSEAGKSVGQLPTFAFNSSNQLTMSIRSGMAAGS